MIHADESMFADGSVDATNASFGVGAAYLPPGIWISDKLMSANP
jgi:hypothetical protein